MMVFAMVRWCSQVLRQALYRGWSSLSTGLELPVVLTFRNGGANQKKARGWESEHGAGKNGDTQTMLTSFPRNRFPVHSPRE